MRKRIFGVPYWFDASLVMIRCRTPADGILRGTAYAEFDMLDDAEAPMAAEIDLPQTDGPAERLELRDDGRSLLRPVRTGGPGNDQRVTGIPMTVDAFEAMAAFDLELRTPDCDFPEVWLRRGMTKLREIKIFGERHALVDPAALHTVDTVPVREWVKTSSEAVEKATVKSAGGYVFVDGVLHRRVPAPLWRSNAYRPLLHGEDIPSSLKTYEPGDTFWWPLNLSDDMTACFAAGKAGNPRPAPRVALHRWPSVRNELAYSGSVGLCAVTSYIHLAVPRMSDENVERFKLYRHAADRAADDFDACREAMDLLALMIQDPRWDEGQGRYHRTPSRTIVSGQIRHWRRLVDAAGIDGLDEADDEALGGIAA